MVVFVVVLPRIRVSCIAIAVFYYILRPKRERRFKKWWVRGRYVVLMSLGMGIVSVVSSMDIFGWMVTGQWLVHFSDNVCDDATGGTAFTRYVFFVFTALTSRPYRYTGS